MKDDFDRATERAQRCMLSILQHDIPAAIAAADTGRHEDAHATITAWAMVGDS